MFVVGFNLVLIILIPIVLTHEQARLFYEEKHVSMVTTKPIKEGEQIVCPSLFFSSLRGRFLNIYPHDVFLLMQWNTYGDPPNSDLLRRYGHVDLVPLADGPLGNPADVIEIKANLLLEVASSVSSSSLEGGQGKERIDWWLEQGGDEYVRFILAISVPSLYTPFTDARELSVFVIEASNPSLPADFSSLLRLLLMPVPEWKKTEKKGKPPKSKLDIPLAKTAIQVLQKRESMYETSLEVSPLC